MDTLSVDLQVTDDQADIVLDRAQTKFEDFAKKVDGINPSLGRRMAVDFELAERRADSVQKKFAAIATTRIETGQFDALTRTAIRAENRANSLRTELEALRKAAATTSNTSILAQLEGQAKGLQSELVKVEALQGRIAVNQPPSGSSGGHGGLSLSNIATGGQIRGAGPLFRAAGLYQYGIDESILNVANSARMAIGLSGEALVAFGGLAAAGLAVYEISEKVLANAEKRLHVEEDIAGAFNRQIRGIEEMYASYEKFKQLVENSGNFSTNVEHLIKSGDRTGLRSLLDQVDADNKATIAKIDLLQKDQLNNESLLELTKNRSTHGAGNKNLLRDIASALPLGDLYGSSLPDSPLASDAFTSSDKNQEIAHRTTLLEQNKKDLTDLAETLKAGQDQFVQIKKGLGDITDNESDLFDQRWKKYLKAQEDAEKKRLELVDQEEKKIEELGKTWTSAFDSLSQRTSGENPFAAFLAKSQTEADKLKESLKGLPPELQKIAFTMEAVAQGKEAFSLRLDNALSVANLRFEAKNFLDPTQTEMQRRLNADIANFQRSSNSTNPDAFAQFQRRQNSINNYDKDRRNDLLNSEYNDIYDTRRKGYDPALADRKFADITRGLNASDLPDNLRRAAADARINEAARQEKFETDAEQDRKEDREVRKKFSAAVDKLSNLVVTQGGQQLKVVLENETKGAYDAKVTSATPDDVAAQYGTVSGPGGLTNF